MLFASNRNIYAMTSETWNEARAPSRGGGEDCGRTETPTVGNWAYKIAGERYILILLIRSEIKQQATVKMQFVIKLINGLHCKTRQQYCLAMKETIRRLSITVSRNACLFPEIILYGNLPDGLSNLLYKLRTKPAGGNFILTLCTLTEFWANSRWIWNDNQISMVK